MVRPLSGESFGAELSAENRRMMYVPKGFAHGFLTLADDTEAFYFVDEFYSPEHERCIRYNDPKFAMQWPAAPSVISDKDKNQPDFDAAWHLAGMKILFTGASSFTGYWFAKQLASAGHEVFALFRRQPERISR